MKCVSPIRNDHVYPCDSDGYQNELLCTNSQTEYTNKWSRWCVGQLQCRLVDCRNLIFFIEMICWASWFSQIQSTGLLSVFLEHSLMYLWWYYFLICFVSYSWLIRTLSYSKLVEKKLRIKLNWTTTYNDVLSLICYSHLYIIMIIHSDSTINSGLQGLLSALGKPKSNPVQQVSFYSDKENKNDTISEHDERRK